MQKLVSLLVTCAAALIACGGDGSNAGPDAGGDGDGGVTPDGPVMPVAPGADPTFGSGGLATAGFPGGLAGIMRIARQSDGKLVGVGGTQESLVIARVTATGAFDPTFGDDGVVQLPWGAATSGVAVGYGCAIQPDGKILAAARMIGSYDGLLPAEIVVRLNPDGSLDTSFAGKGYVVGARGTGAQSLALDANGRVVVGGYGRLERYLADGTLDTTFGTAGVTMLSTNAQDLALQPDGKIVTIGGRAISRFTAAGAADMTFGTNGSVTVPGTQSYDALYAIIVQADGSILVGGGITTTSNQDFWIGKYTSAGVPDTTFGTAGAVTGDPNTGGTALGIAVDASGRVIGSGGLQLGGKYGTNARFTASGAVDTTFGTGGLGPQLRGSAFSNLVVEPDGAFVVGGAFIDMMTFGYNIGFARTDAAGAADMTFNAAAQRRVGGSFDRAHAVAVQPDGKILLGGWAYGGGGAGLVRLNHDGSLDTAFGTGGRALDGGGLIYITAIAVQPSGKILVGGLSGYSSGGTRKLAVERFDQNGSLDMSFGTMGVAGGSIIAGKDAASMTMTVAPDGSIVLAGQTATAATSGYEFGVLELTADGAPNPAFGTGGAAMTAFGTANAYNVATHVAVQPDGAVLALGLSGTSVKLVRFTASGALDTAFGTQVLPTIPQGMYPFGLALQPDGAIVAIEGNYLTGDTRVVRYTATGALDATFGSGGVYAHTFRPNDYYGLYSFYGLTRLPDGKLMVGFAGAASDGLTESGTLLRLNADGTPDESYGPGGAASLAIGRGSVSINALALDGDGKLLVVGRVWTASGGSEYMAVRLIL